jgi:small conductance mechanosensitive channel
LRIAIVLALLLGLHRLVRRIAPRTVAMALRLGQDSKGTAQPIAPAELAKRTETLVHVLVRSVEVLLLLLGSLTVLAEIGINIGPILAGAGVAGIAIGFGAQAVVRDLLAGLFILLENQFGRGDVVKIAGVAGLVEDVNLRRTVLRDLDGTVHNVPNGEIHVASNLTRGWSRVDLNVTVGYGEDLDHVRTVLDEVGAELATDPDWGPLILEAPKVLRVDAFGEYGIALKVLATTQPIRQWDVAGELRRRIKHAFGREGIEIPLPNHLVVDQRAERSAAGSPPHGAPSAYSGAMRDS